MKKCWSGWPPESSGGTVRGSEESCMRRQHSSFLGFSMFGPLGRISSVFRLVARLYVGFTPFVSLLGSARFINKIDGKIKKRDGLKNT